MRTFSKNEMSVNYPDEHCYIFNPVPIIISGGDEGQRIAIRVADVTITASTFGGKATFNIAEVLQSLFDIRQLSIVELSAEVQPSPTAKMVSVSVPSLDLTFTTLAVWGALQTDCGAMLTGDFNYDYSSDFLRGVLKGLSQNEIWHIGMPFTLSIPMLAGDSIAMRIDKADEVEIYKAINHEIVNVAPATIVAKRKLTVTSSIKFILKGEGLVKRTYNVYPQSSTDGLYLRWIDKKGYYCYYEFEKGVDSFQTDKVGTFITNNSRSIDYVDGFNGGDGRQQGRTACRSIEIASPLVTTSVWAYLLGMTQSPIVDIYTDNDYLGTPRFLKTEVVTGKTARGGGDLSDFVTTITLPSYTNQQL